MITKINNNPRCPCCNKPLGIAVGLTSSKRSPNNGDISICLFCATILSFRVNDNNEVTGYDIVEKKYMEMVKFKFPELYDTLIEEKSFILGIIEQIEKDYSKEALNVVVSKNDLTFREFLIIKEMGKRIPEI